MKLLDFKTVLPIILGLVFTAHFSLAQTTLFSFDENIKSELSSFEGNDYGFVIGIEEQALSLDSANGFKPLYLDQLPFNSSKDFTIQFWVKTSSVYPTVLLSQKDFTNKGMTAQKNAGWALYSSGGTFAWSIASDERRINYERDNGLNMPIADGEWHQLTMSYNRSIKEVRLYYDGINKAIYKVGFDFNNEQPLQIGASSNNFDYDNEVLEEIKSGAMLLQALVDEFNSLGDEKLNDDELISVVVDPKGLLEAKIQKITTGQTALIKQLKTADLKFVNDARNELLTNPYTIHQIREFTVIKPLNKIYSLKDGIVQISNEQATYFTEQERFYPADFAVDNLRISENTMNADEVLSSFTAHKKTKPIKLKKNIKELTVGVWNIWHGGIHFTPEEHGWDSRMRIVEILRELDTDVILMQETYSSGDFIAAELGYYFATTSDWDYRQQGSNISVLSRYPIEELEVLEETEFMNVAAKLKLSETQTIWAMSNWYGMNSFPSVYDFHAERFAESDNTPILFGGDFNAVPHTDGGDSPASVKMLDNGFTDAYRSLHPNVTLDSAYTHNSGVRIDQLYYKGKGLLNQSTEVINDWPMGFPSDHFLILSKFKLKY
jgi:endonuclease/exonuclease/phosphatase (EEP) superfamily protein YafD